MSVSWDNFGLWLSCRDKLDSLVHNDIKNHVNDIVGIYGGFKEMLELCLVNANNLNIPQHQELFQLLSDINKNKNCSNQEQISPLLSVCDTSISNIFQFLSAKDHKNLQQSCRQLTIIGRRKESYITIPDPHWIWEYPYFGGHLRFIHQSKHDISRLTSSDTKEQSQVLAEWYDADVTAENIIQTGLVPMLTEWIITRGDRRLFTDSWELLFQTQIIWDSDCLRQAILDNLAFHLKSNFDDRETYVFAVCLRMAHAYFCLISMGKVPSAEIRMRSNILGSIVGNMNKLLDSYRFCDGIRAISEIIYHESFDLHDHGNLRIMKDLWNGLFSQRLHGQDCVFDGPECYDERLRIIAKIYKQLKLDIAVDQNLIERLKVMIKRANNPAVAMELAVDIVPKLNTCAR